MSPTAHVMFDVQLASDGKTLLINLRGTKLDATFAQELRSTIDKVWKPTVESVSVDMTSVEFIDSMGVGALVGVHKRMPIQSARTVLLNPSPAVVTILEIVRLDRVFELRRT